MCVCVCACVCVSVCLHVSMCVSVCVCAVQKCLRPFWEFNESCGHCIQIISTPNWAFSIRVSQFPKTKQKSLDIHFPLTIISWGVPRWCSWLRTICCHCYGSGCCCAVGSISGPGISAYHGYSQKKIISWKREKYTHCCMLFKKITCEFSLASY